MRDLLLLSLAKCLVTMAAHSWFSSCMFMCDWQQMKLKSLYWYIIIIISRKWILYICLNKSFWKTTQSHYEVCRYMYLVCNSDSHYALFIHTVIHTDNSYQHSVNLVNWGLLDYSAAELRNITPQNGLGCMLCTHPITSSSSSSLSSFRCYMIAHPDRPPS